MAKYNFTASLGRTGTLWLANFIDESNGVVGSHELVQDDQPLHGFHNPQGSLVYADLYQTMNEIDRELAGRNETKWVEVNCRLRYSAPAFISEDDVRSLFYFRNPKKVVNSHYRRGNFAEDNHWTQKMVPKDYSYEYWVNQKSRFERICFIVSHGNRYLSGLYPEERWMKLEKLNEDYDYLDEKLNGVFGLDISKSLWQKHRNNPKHRTGGDNDPSDQWSNQQEKIFDQHCGNLMSELGYGS